MLKNNGFHNRHSPILRAFSPLSLFSGGAPGAWYDPSDYSTLFQDSAGTTPVTAVEQPVGLMLDKSQGLVLGNELVPSTIPSISGAGWTTNGTSITATSSTASGTIALTASTPSTKFYQVTFTASGLSGATSYMVFSSGVSAVTKRINTAKSYSFIVPGQGTAAFEIAPYEGTAFSVTISNISVRELPGNHAFQATSASRPVLSARYNLHTKTDFLSGANGWLLNGTPTITSDADVPAGQGFTNSTKIVTTGTFQGPYQNVTTVGTSNKKGVWLKGGAGGEVVGITDNGNTGGTVVLTTDWVFYTKTWTTVDAASGILISASGKTVYVAGVDVRSATQSSSLPAYQRVNTSTDYATTGFLPYLKFYVDDSLSTNSISFTSTDKMSVFAGVRKLSDVGANILVELSVAADLNNGSFNVIASNTGDSGKRFQFVSKGSLAFTDAFTTSTAYNAPISLVSTGLGDISGDRATLRLNGAQVGQSTADQGTGNYGNYPLYIGRRGGTSFPFNGQLYSMVIVGKAVTAGELLSTETYVNQKTGAY